MVPIRPSRSNLYSFGSSVSFTRVTSSSPLKLTLPALSLEAAKAKVPEKLDVSNAIASTAARAFPVIFLILFVLLKNHGLRICARLKRNEHNERHGH